MKIYLAGPEVFLLNASSVFQQKKIICSKFHHEGITPFDVEVTSSLSPQETALSIFQKNIQLIQNCDAVVANVTPFRGPHMDLGTAFEIGYAFALQKKIVGYTQNSQLLLDKIPHQKNDTHQVYVDSQHFIVENFCLHDNLMIEMALHTLHYPLILASVEPSEYFVSLQGFEEAVHQLTSTH